MGPGNEQNPHSVSVRTTNRMTVGLCAPDKSYHDEGKVFTKLQKDGILGFDEAIGSSTIGGRSNAGNKRELGLGRLWWTGFASGASRC